MEEYISWETNTIICKFGDKSDFAYCERGGCRNFIENGTKVGYERKEVFEQSILLLDTPRTVLTIAIEKSRAR